MAERSLIGKTGTVSGKVAPNATGEVVVELGIHEQQLGSHVIGEEERKIRKDPVGTGSAILSKVFGSLR